MLDKNDIVKLSEVFVTKDDLEKSEHRLEDKIIEFKSEILTGQDEIIGKLDKLLGEKTISDEQDKKQKKVLEVHNNVLKRGKILSEQEAIEVNQMQAF